MLTERIDQAMKRATESGGCFALMFMDLDGFKPVNDAFGHHTGDLLLRQVALRLRNSLHRRDTTAESAAMSSFCWWSFKTPRMH